MRPILPRVLGLALLATLAACGGDPVEPLAPAARPALLLAAGESWRPISETVDAAGNRISVQELAAGTVLLPDGGATSVASVTIRTVVPPLPVGATSSPCITSTILKVETTPGWSYAIRKSGGCDKEIVVGLENRATGQRATFSFLMIFGKTKVDHGLVR